MKVKDVMTPGAAFCTPDMNLGAAVEQLWRHNCGILPVVNSEAKVVSVITDRDICIALGTRNRLPGDITVGEVATQRAICCRGNEDVRAALITMAELKLRRLPVVDAQGKLEGLLSMDDVVEASRPSAKGNSLTSEDVVGALKRVVAPQLPAEQGKPAAA